MVYFLELLIMFNIYVMLISSANITVGLANMMSMCQAAFYGIGAYSGAVLMLNFHIPFIIAAIMVMIVSGISSLFVSLAAVRLKGDFFIIATLGFQMMIYSLLHNLTHITGGSNGISGIPGINLGKYEINSSDVFSYWLITFSVMLIVISLFHYLKKTPYGRYLYAIRANEITIQSFGQNTHMLRTWAFFISAAVSGLAGLLYAAYNSHIDPSLFTVDESFFIISGLFIGGAINTKGSIAGAVFAVLLPALLVIDVDSSMSVYVRQIIYGLILILTVFIRPQGICGKIIE